jgi:hypothetical protein
MLIKFMGKDRRIPIKKMIKNKNKNRKISHSELQVNKIMKFFCLNAVHCR